MRLKVISIIAILIMVTSISFSNDIDKQKNNDKSFLLTESYNSFIENIKKKKQITVLLYGSISCGPCIKMKKNISSDTNTKEYLINNFNFKYLNQDCKYYSEYKKALNPYAYPTTIIFNSNAEEIIRITGYNKNEKYVKILDRISKLEKLELFYIIDEIGKDDKKLVLDMISAEINNSLNNKNNPKMARKLLKLYSKYEDDKMEYLHSMLLIARYYGYTKKNEKIARYYYRKAIKESKNNNSIYIRALTSYATYNSMVLKKYDIAEKYFFIAIKKEKGLFKRSIYEYLMNVYYTKYNLDKAIKLAEEKLPDTISHIHLMLAYLYTKNNNDDKILKLYDDIKVTSMAEFKEKYKGQESYILPIYLNFISTIAEKLPKKELLEAIKLIEDNQDLFIKDMYHNYGLLSNIYFYAGEKEKAIDTLELMLNLYPDNFDVKVQYYGYMQLFDNEIEKNFEEFLKLKDEYKDLSYTYYKVESRYYEKLEKYKEAIKSLEKAAEISGFNFEIEDRIKELKEKMNE